MQWEKQKQNMISWKYLIFSVVEDVLHLCVKLGSEKNAEWLQYI